MKAIVLSALLALASSAQAFQEFGVRDGMTLDEAKDALKAAFPTARLIQLKPDILVVQKDKGDFNLGPGIHLCEGKVFLITYSLDVEPTWRNFIALANENNKRYGNVYSTAIQYEPVVGRMGDAYFLTLIWRKGKEDFLLRLSGAEKAGAPTIDKTILTTDNICGEKLNF